MGGSAYQPSCLAFEECLNECNLMDLGFKGPPYTWVRGDLRERLDRVVCNPDWQNM